MRAAPSPARQLFTRQAFTLIELLVVVAIIAVLAGIALPVFNSVQLAGRKTQSLSNMRQLGTALLAYCGDNNGVFPNQGDTAPTWSAAAVNTTDENNCWYNVLLRNYANSKGVGDYAVSTAAFYTKANLLYVPAATYPASKLSSPQFAVAFNSKIEGTSSNARMPLLVTPAETVIFQESGLPGEKAMKGQAAYTNQSYSYASRTVARYGGQTILTFADGHSGAFIGTDVVDPNSGKAYFPPKTTASVYWETDPTVSPN